MLTYHPALNKVYEILKENSKLILVDDEHKEVFQNKIFLSFQRAKNLKDQLVRAKLPSVGEPPLTKGTYRCNGRKSCHICNVITEGDSFENSDENRSFKNFSGRYNCNSENVVYLMQCEICSKKYVGSTKTKFRQRFNVYTSYFRSYARKHVVLEKRLVFHRRTKTYDLLDRSQQCKGETRRDISQWIQWLNNFCDWL